MRVERRVSRRRIGLGVALLLGISACKAMHSLPPIERGGGAGGWMVDGSVEGEARLSLEGARVLIWLRTGDELGADELELAHEWVAAELEELEAEAVPFELGSDWVDSERALLDAWSEASAREAMARATGAEWGLELSLLRTSFATAEEQEQAWSEEDDPPRLRGVEQLLGRPMSPQFMDRLSARVGVRLVDARSGVLMRHAELDLWNRSEVDEERRAAVLAAAVALVLDEEASAGEIGGLRSTFRESQGALPIWTEPRATELRSAEALQGLLYELREFDVDENLPPLDAALLEERARELLARAGLSQAPRQSAVRVELRGEALGAGRSWLHVRALFHDGPTMQPSREVVLAEHMLYADADGEGAFESAVGEALLATLELALARILDAD